MSWFRKPINLGISIGSAVLFVVAIVLIIWGVSTHREAGLLEVCWVNGGALYVAGSEVDNGPCEGAEELVWSKEQIPLTVAAVAPTGEDLAPGATSRRALDAASTDINHQLGFELFRAVSLSSGADVVVYLGEAIDAGTKRGASRFGYVTHNRNAAGMVRAVVHIYSNADSERLEYRVSHHELLHAAGLAHDSDDPGSAIYPLTGDDSTVRMGSDRITDRDRELLRRLYR